MVKLTQTPFCLPKSLNPLPFWSLAQLLLPSHFFPTSTNLTLDLQLNNIHGLIILDVNLTVPKRTNYWSRDKTSSTWTVALAEGSSLDNNSYFLPLLKLRNCTPFTSSHPHTTSSKTRSKQPFLSTACSAELWGPCQEENLNLQQQLVWPYKGV